MSSAVPTTQNQELAIDTLRSMKRQESGCYRIPTSHLLEATSNPDAAVTIGQQQQFSMRQAELSAYLAWRRMMVQWCYRIADSCKFSKETVEICISLLDRYVATCPALMVDAANYQLSCMACLYMACKMNEASCLSPAQMEKISGCQFDSEALEASEYKILTALQWRVNPPTAIAFARSLLGSLNLQQDFGLSLEQRDSILSAVELQIEQATADELFVPIRKSGIALAAILNASRCYLAKGNLLWKFEVAMSQALGYEMQTSHRHQKIEQLQHALLGVVATSQGFEYCPPQEQRQDEDAEVEDYFDCRTKEEAPVTAKSLMHGEYIRPRSPRSVSMQK